MVELQEVLFELLCEFDEICRSNGIKYYLSGGTNLGALRHGGFIPWDDDADVRMPRKEYEKLEKIIDSVKPENRELVSHERFPNYWSTIPRYMNLNTTSIPRGRMTDKTPHGIFIDILILDPIPRQEDELSEWKKNHYVFCELLERSATNGARPSDWDGIDIKRYREYEKRARSEGKDAVLDELRGKLFNIDESESDYYCMRFGTTWFGVTPIEWYGQPRDIPFEGHNLCVANKAELCAYANYGYEWRYIPNIDKRTGHATFIVTELDTGNLEREYSRIIDMSELDDVVARYKDKRLEYMDMKFKIFDDRAKPYIYFINYEIDKKIKENGIEYYKENLEEGNKLFEEYMTLQLKLPYSRNNKYVELPDKYADLLTYICYKLNKLSKLEIILSVRKNATGNLTEYQDSILCFCKDMVQMMMNIDLKQFDEAKKQLEKHKEQHGDNLQVIKGILQIGLNDADSFEDYDALVKYSESMLEKYPENGEILKYLGDALEGIGEKEKASEAYEKALEDITNGLILVDLMNKGIEKAGVRMDELCNKQFVGDN